MSELNIKSSELLKQVKKSIANDIDAEFLVDKLKKFREALSEQNLPRLKKAIRLTYEHLEEFGNFNIPIPEYKSIEEPEEEEQEEGEQLPDEVEDMAPSKLECLNYLISLMEDSTHKINASELKDFILLFEAYKG